MTALTDIYRQLQRKAHAWRNPILTLAAVAFAAALVVSIDHLQIGIGDLRLCPLLVLAIVLVPLQTGYSAINTVVMGEAAGGRISFLLALRVNIYAQLAEFLPIPGGAIVRAGALVEAGATPMRAAEVIMAFSILWIACGAIGAGFALAGSLPGNVLLACGIPALCLILVISARRIGARLVAMALTLRIIGLAIVAARVFAAFAAIGTSIEPSATLSFAFANILGSAASLVPAGLGVSEGLSALLAQPVGVAPAAAFLAIALGRIVALALHAAMALLMAALGVLPKSSLAAQRR